MKRRVFILGSAGLPFSISAHPNLLEEKIKPPTQAGLRTTDKLPLCSTEKYNSLPDLDTATRNLRSFTKSFDDFVASAVAALRNSGFPNGTLGAFLLHRHWELEPGMMMVERPRVLTSGKVGLITYQQNIREALASGVSPSRWAFDEVTSDFVSLEYSSDPEVRDVAELFRENDGLRANLVLAIQQQRLQSIIGLMVIPRRSLRSHPSNDFVESNDDGISVVRLERLSAADKAKSIITGWTLSKSRRGSVFACCYCSHGPDHTCKHPKPDPPVCQPHGCV
jgi:hypothetical protein